MFPHSRCYPRLAPGRSEPFKDGLGTKGGQLEVRKLRVVAADGYSASIGTQLQQRAVEVDLRDSAQVNCLHAASTASMCEVNPAVGDVPLPVAAAQGAEAHQGPRASLPGDS